MSLAQPDSKTKSQMPAAWRVRNAMIGLGSAFFSMLSFSASAAEFKIPADRDALVFDGQSRGVRPGDVIEIAAGIHGPITFRNIVGSSDRPIVIRNDASGQAVIRRANPSSGGYVLKLEASQHFVLDGSNIARDKDGYPYGIKVTYASGATSSNKDAPLAFLKTSGIGTSKFNNCTHFVVRSVQIDGGWPTYSSNGTGISTNDHAFTRSAFPTAWQENFVIEHSDVRNVENEGMYIGPNFYKGGIPIRNVVVRYNNVENTGFDGIQVKSPLEGSNLIHHNKLKMVGARTGADIQGQLSGISLLDGSGKIFNNYVERSGDTAIQHWLGGLPASFGPQPVEIYNNVVVDAGVTGATGNQGINSGHAPTDRNGVETASVLPKIYHNTIVRPRGWGIVIAKDSSAQSFVEDNVIVDAGDGAIRAPSIVNTSRNRTGSITQMQFVNPDGFDFRLRSASPARNAGGDRFPPEDFDDNKRPKDGRADQGAFEYGSELEPARPAPPIISAIE